MTYEQVKEQDKKFLEITSNWDSHLPMLLIALSITEGRVTELGSGMGSTPLLRDYCAANNREFASYEYSKEWAEKTGSIYVPNWYENNDWQAPCGLLFVDQSPGEHRWVSMVEMANKADIIVVHDSEEVGAGDYQLKKAWPHFKHRLNYNRLGPGAGCSMVSNTVDLSLYAGDFNGYVFE